MFAPDSTINRVPDEALLPTRRAGSDAAKHAHGQPRGAGGADDDGKALVRSLQDEMGAGDRARLVPGRIVEIAFALKFGTSVLAMVLSQEAGKLRVATIGEHRRREEMCGRITAQLDACTAPKLACAQDRVRDLWVGQRLQRRQTRQPQRRALAALYHP